jgi:hypothetical protein
MSYSIEVMKRYAFENELMSYLKLKEIPEGEEVQKIIIAYLERRIEEIKKQHK